MLAVRQWTGVFAAIGLVFSTSGRAQEPPARGVDLGTLQVTATPLPESIATVPASVSVVTHDELVRLGATDLRTALSLVGGVDIAPGGMSGPAGSVPEFQGLREFDAFLLLVDGVPWGGAFNPDLPSIDLNGVARIEVLRGAAPVKYGTTSFVGVINVIHRAPGESTPRVAFSAGSRASAGVALETPLHGDGPLKQSLAVDVARRNLRDDRAGYDRQHLLYRNAVETGGGGRFHLDFDVLRLQQSPQSPYPLDDQAEGLSPDVRMDSNQNPSDSRMNQERYHLVSGFDAPVGAGTWSTTVATTFRHQRNIRGFLRADNFQTGGGANADGFRQSVDQTDVYFDSHLQQELEPGLELVIGFNALYGSGEQQSDNFEYYADPAGATPPSSESRPVDEQTRLRDRRAFLGLYAQADWTFAPRWDFQAGVRLNRTIENRDTALWPSQASGEPAAHDSARAAKTRPSGVLALSHTLWNDQDGRLAAYASWRNTFKPAAVDFGPEAEGDILAPETARSWEAGLKGYLAAAALEWDAHLFSTDFDNVVIPEAQGNLPGTESGGRQRLRGLELDARGRIAGDWQWHAAYAFHQAEFRDFLEAHNGQAVQLSGNRLVMSPRHLFKAGIGYRPERGWQGYANLTAVGSRYYDRENDILAPGYGIVDAGVAYRFDRWTLRLDGRNLTDRRPAVSESELGPDQFYVMPARYVELGATFGWD